MAPTQKEEFKGDKGLASPQTRNSGWVKKVWSSLAIPVLTDIRVSFCSPGGPDPVPLTSGARNCRIIVVPWPSRPTGGLHTLQCHETDGRPTIAAAAALPRVAFHARDMRPGTKRTLRGDECQTATAESTQHPIASKKASL